MTDKSIDLAMELMPSAATIAAGVLRAGVCDGKEAEELIVRRAVRLTMLLNLGLIDAVRGTLALADSEKRHEGNHPRNQAQ